MEKALKVAFATSDMQRVDQHFGAARSFAVYAVDTERFALTEAVQFGDAVMDGNEDKLAPKIAALEGCIAVYAQAIGGSAVTQLRSKGIHAVKVPPGSEIKELLKALLAEQQAGQTHSPMLKRKRASDPSRFDAMAAEGWEE